MMLAPAPAFGVENLSYRSSFGPVGTSGTDFARVGAVAVDQGTGDVYAIDREAGSLSKFDATGMPLAFTGTAAYIVGNEINGLSYYPNTGESQVAVDPTNHTVYVTSGTTVRAFQANGEPAEFTAGPGAGTSEIPGFTELLGLAVDANGTIYASDYSSGMVKIYASTGEAITQLETSSPANLAVAPDGSVYVNRWRGSVLEFTPSEFPVTSASTYSEAAAPLDENVSFSVAVDSLTSEVYIAERFPDDFQFSRVAEYDQDGVLVGFFGGPGEEGQLADGIAGVAVNGATGAVFVSSDSELGDTYSKVSIFGPMVIPVSAPTVAGTSVTGVTADSATVRARINPNTLTTGYRFEYGLGNCSSIPNPCEVIAPDGQLPEGHDEVGVFRFIDRLLPGSTYHYRVVAENSLGVTEGPDRTFRTQLDSVGLRLSDSRVWEMVSPVSKFGGSIQLSKLAIVQAAASGDGLVYSSRGAIEASPEGNRALEPSSLLARRHEDAWQSSDLTPKHTEASGVRFSGEYKIFASDLSTGVLEPRDETPLSPASSERTPYLRTTRLPSVYTPLVTSKDGYANVPSGTHFGGGEALSGRNPVSVSAVNPAQTHIVVASKAPLVPGASANSLYMWIDGGLQPVSELPGDEGGGIVAAQVGSGAGSIRHALSNDGSRVFWSPGEGYTAAGISIPALYLHKTETGESVRLDVVQPGASPVDPANPAFQGANADGTKVFFTDSRQLTEGASLEGRDLYACEIPPEVAMSGCNALIDLTEPLEGSGDAARVQDVIPGLSDDGSQLYFVARGVLDTRPSKFGESAVSGQFNLYGLHEGESPRFIASLSSRDYADWGAAESQPVGFASQLGAMSSANGRYFAFMSERSLTGYENQSSASGEPSEEVFLYDASSDVLSCVSCDPSNGSPIGRRLPEAGNGAVAPAVDPQGLWAERWVAATLPEASEGENLGLSFYRPRAVLNSGRVFFNAADGLVPADSNGAWDVYQYEPIGRGSCSAVSGDAGVSRTDEGCVGLVSGGTGKGDSAFLDASASGDDVFFLSPQRLSALDSDDAVDVYDARVGGKLAVIEPRTECQAESCQPRSLPPGSPDIASAAYDGPGNVKARRHCTKGQHRVHRNRGARCVASKQRKHRRHHRRASADGRDHR
jgi:hypothetical protein